MPRPFRARALAVLVIAIAAAGCQDYNFNPVGHCLLQPGTQRFTLSNISSADVLFVVDDSGTMAGEQARLADAFADFVDNLTSTNRARAQGGLLPLDFHVAVTTSSVFQNDVPLGSPQICRADCAGAGGKLACCVGNQPVYGPRRCTELGSTAASQCPMQPGTACRNTCAGLKGELYCCAADGSFPLAAVSAAYGQITTCNLEGVPCGALKTHYAFTDTQCTAGTRGVALDGFPYPDGAFVGSTSLAPVAANPRVLHFDKRMYLSSAGKNAQGFTMAQLKRFFEQNIRVGTCGSAQEQGLQASLQAMKDALAGNQLDTYAYDWVQGLTSGSSTAAAQFTAPGGIPTPGAKAVWPKPDGTSKIVVVYVGDEDDCSSPKDRSGGVVLADAPAGADACTADATQSPPLGGKQFPVSTFVNYLTGLGRPVGAAFVVSATSSGDDVDCRNEGCSANVCCDRPCVSGVQQSHLSDPGYPGSPFSLLCGTPGDPASCVCAYDVCGGQAPGTRFVETAKQLRTKGADVVVGSVCGDFKPLLREVAEIVKPPQTLSLPTVPAESAIAILRIAGPDGQTRKICGRPLPPTRPNYTRAEAQATRSDWWFVATGDPAAPFDPSPTATTAPVSSPTKFVYINPQGSCIANPGETYSADYLGVVPAGGCTIQSGEVLPGPDNVLDTPDDVVLGSADCQAKLGGRFGDWACHVPTGLTTGTCTCRSGG
jgi:hypothetical protein